MGSRRGENMRSDMCLKIPKLAMGTLPVGKDDWDSDQAQRLRHIMTCLGHRLRPNRSGVRLGLTLD